jgi:cytochrome c oxidase subunit I+III
MGVTLLANAALYLSLLFGWFYLWTVAPAWLVPERAGQGGGWLLGSALLLSVGTLWLRRVLKRLRRGDDRRLQGQLAVLCGLALVQSALVLGALLSADLQPRTTAHDALVLVILLYSLMHCVLAALLTGLQAWRVAYGYVNAASPYEPLVVGPLWTYNLAVVWSSYLAVMLFPLGWSTGG